MSYQIVPVTPDTPEWLEERRRSVGASEVAAIMGLSSYSTPLQVYKSKHGVDTPFDDLLAFVGHESEVIIDHWVHKFSGVNVSLRPGFMARNPEFPHLHASFDRVSDDPFTTWQFKTATQYMSHQWDEGIPDGYRVQVQAEMAVAGTERAAVVVWIGGREFRLFWEARDDRFIRNHLAPAVEAFWAHVEDGTPPEPSTIPETYELHVEAGKTAEADDTVVEAIGRRAVLLSDIKAQKEEADALQVAIAAWMGDADTITRDGRNILTYRFQKGRTSLDTKRLREDQPELVNAYTTQGAPFRVMRTPKSKDVK